MGGEIGHGYFLTVLLDGCEINSRPASTSHNVRVESGMWSLPTFQ